METQTKRSVKHACYNCQRSHAFCDQERPCGRCVKLNLSDLCFETPMKKRGRKPAFDSARARALHENSAAGLVTVPHQRANRVESISSQEVSPEDLNLVLINELRELKANQRRLREELQRLKANEPIVEQTPGALQKASANTTNAAPLAVNDKAIVIYDLTKFPAVVKTANETFCRMLGYDLQEVLGQPWTKFVHPAYHERVLQIFNTQPLRAIIEFDLVYRHRNGGLFSTYDQHTIIFSPEGLPVSDLVAIKLNPHCVSAPIPILPSSRPTPLLTGEVSATPVTSSSPYSRYAPLSLMSDDVDAAHRFRDLSINDPSAPAAVRPASLSRSPFAPSPPRSPMTLSASPIQPYDLNHHWMPDPEPGGIDPSLLSASPSRFLTDDPFGTTLQPLDDVTPLPLPHPEPNVDPLNDDELMQLLNTDMQGPSDGTVGGAG